MYRDTIHTMMDFVESSRLLPPLQAPFPADQQPPQQPTQPLTQDQQPTTSYVDMIPPPPTQPPRNNRWQQSVTGTWDSNPFVGSYWDTQMPISGQRTASASFPSNMPPRPSSTPNISQSSIPNISGLSDMLNTPNMQDQSLLQPQGGPVTSGGGFF